MLIEELKKGSPEAFRVLIEQYSQAVFKTCYSFVNNREDAEDIAQEVFMEVHKSVCQFRSESQLKTWIYRVSINKSLDFLRSRKRKKRVADFAALFMFKNKPVGTPSDKLEQKERKEILRQQIALLAENQRIAIVLSQYDKLSNKLIAEIMGVSESAVESLLHRGRANLRKQLAGYFEKNL